MGEIVKSLKDGHYLYKFSADILMVVRRNAHIVAEAADDALVFALNLSSIFLSGSFLEATLNEQIAMAARNGTQTIKPTPEFWITLNDMQKNLTVTDKWNLIASTTGGQQWDGAREPFQSHDTLITLRNELVHFKGRYAADDTPPTRRLQPLLDKFKTVRDWKLEGMNIDPWLVSLVKSKKLGLWIDSTIFALHSQLEELLLGITLTQDRKAIEEMIRHSRYGSPPKSVEGKIRNSKNKRG